VAWERGYRKRGAKNLGNNRTLIKLLLLNGFKTEDTGVKRGVLSKGVNQIRGLCRNYKG